MDPSCWYGSSSIKRNTSNGDEARPPTVKSRSEVRQGAQTQREGQKAPQSHNEQVPSWLVSTRKATSARSAHPTTRDRTVDEGIQAALILQPARKRARVRVRQSRQVRESPSVVSSPTDTTRANEAIRDTLPVIVPSRARNDAAPVTNSAPVPAIAVTAKWKNKNNRRRGTSPISSVTASGTDANPVTAPTDTAAEEESKSDAASTGAATTVGPITDDTATKYAMSNIRTIKKDDTSDPAPTVAATKTANQRDAAPVTVVRGLTSNIAIESDAATATAINKTPATEKASTSAIAIPGTALQITKTKGPSSDKRKKPPQALPPPPISLRCAATGKVHEPTGANSSTRRYDIQRVPDTLRVRLRMLAARDVALRGVRKVRSKGGGEAHGIMGVGKGGEERLGDQCATGKRGEVRPDDQRETGKGSEERLGDQHTTDMEVKSTSSNHEAGVQADGEVVSSPDATGRGDGETGYSPSDDQRRGGRHKRSITGRQGKDATVSSQPSSSSTRGGASPAPTQQPPYLTLPPALHRKPKTAEQEAMARDVMRLYEIAQRAGDGVWHGGERPRPYSKLGDDVARPREDTRMTRQSSNTATRQDQDTKPHGQFELSASGKHGISRVDTKETTKLPAVDTAAFGSTRHPVPRTTLCHAPMWSMTTLADLQSLTPLCPDVSKYGSVHLRLSRGGLARGVLLTGCEVGLGLDSDGVLQFDMPIRGGSVKTTEDDKAVVKSQDGKVLATTASIVKSEPVDESTSSAAPLDPQPSISDVRLEVQGDRRETPPSASPQGAELPQYGVPQVPPSVSTTGDPICDGVIEAYVHRTPLYVFLSGRKACHDAGECFCTQHNCGGLAVLPCGLLAKVKALGVGWAFVHSAHVEEGSNVLSVKVRVVRADAEAPFWWVDDETYDHRNTLTSPEPNHTRSTLCPKCSCVMPHLHWSYWKCPHCGHTLQAGEFDLRSHIPPPIANEVGMRMDHGRAIFDTTYVTRDIRTSESKKKGGKKRVSYCTTSGTTLKNEGTSSASGAQLLVSHYLANGKARRKADDILRCVLAPSTPLQRKSTKGVFALSMRLCDDDVGASTMDHTPAPPLIDCPRLNPNEHTTLATSILDAVERIERLAKTPTLDTVQVTFQDRKSSTILVQPSQTTRRIAYLHLGSNAHLSIFRSDPLCPRQRRQQTVLNALVGHGDVVTIDASRDSAWSVRVDCTETCVNFICV